MEMALMLMQLWLEQVLGLKGRDWLPGTERWVDSANHAPRTVRMVGVELRDGSQMGYFFDLGRAVSFGRETSGGPMPPPKPKPTTTTTPIPIPIPIPIPTPEPAPVPPPQPPPVPRARALGLVPVTGPLPISESAREGGVAAIEKPVTEPVPVSVPVSQELTELLNRKEPWPHGCALAQRQGVDWGWWLTLAACAAVGAIAVALWKPSRSAEGPRLVPAMQEGVRK
jgi:hypothetical protein